MRKAPSTYAIDFFLIFVAFDKEGIMVIPMQIDRVQFQTGISKAIVAVGTIVG